MKLSLKTTLFPLALAASPVHAFAHTGIGDTSGFLHGFAHPASGIDHVLAMLAVGLFATALGGRALWLVPAAFVAMLAAGALLGIAGADVPFVETGIAASVIVLGLVVALPVSLPLASAVALTGFFAVFHGFAHGAEMPADAPGLGYGLGFMVATALLHAAGVGIGLGIARFGGAKSRLALRASGSVMALAGAGILAGYL